MSNHFLACTRRDSDGHLTDGEQLGLSVVS